ncbi:MAG: matrixin family metalloprotease [Planctomycetota bacterium]|jgi:hypothetical protein
MKTRILMAIVVSLLVILVVSPGIPAGNKAQGTGRSNAKGPPEMEVVTFVNTPHWSSPPWYPPEAETNTYRLYKGGVRWASGNPSLDCEVYTLGAPVGAFDAVKPAFAEWDGHTSATIYSTVTEESGTPPGLAYDGSNTVFWGHIDGPGGVIATTQFVFWSNTKELIEFDIIFDHDEEWLATDAPGTLPEPSDPGNPYPNTGQFDVWNVATHELGHTLVLDDLRSPKNGALTMHAYTWPGDATKRDLGSGDELGIKAIYGN